MTLLLPVKSTVFALSLVASLVASQVLAENVPPVRWTDISSTAVQLQNKSTALDPSVNLRSKQSRLLAASHQALDKQMNSSKFQLEIPLPNGQSVTFNLQQNSVLPDVLAAKYPSIRTFTGEQVGNKNNRGRFDITEHGFHAAFKYNGETVYIDPQQNISNELYVSYYKKHALPLTAAIADTTKQRRVKQLPAELSELAVKRSGLASINKRYRIAFSTSAEYSVFHGNSKAPVLAAIATLVNRMNEVFSRDLAVEFVLAENSDAVIFLAPQNPDGSYDYSQDPFDNTDNGVFENPAVVEQYIGIANYDIAHLLTTGAGGLAGVGVVCDNDDFIDAGVNYGGPWKAVGVTGSMAPTNDSFYIDFVAHELGHQLGADHSFNSLSGACSGNRWAVSAYEPGSGSTIMAYTGICAPTNLQTNSDDYFHVNSIIEMREYLINSPSGNSCGAVFESDNQAPVVDGGKDYSIPANTAFTLTAQTTDANNDPIAYTWEQLDLGTASFTADSMVDDGSRPLFRSFQPNNNPARTFPQLASLFSGQLVIGESYATTTRELNFTVTARDNLGGVAIDHVVINVIADDNTFMITKPVNDDNWTEQTSSLILWDVANSNDVNGVNCQFVDIEFSANGGQSFDFSLADNTENDGEQTIDTPQVNTNSGRIKISCADNVFFSVSTTDLDVFNASAPNDIPQITGQTALVINEDMDIEVLLSHIIVADSDNRFPDEFTLTIATGNNYTLVDNSIIPDEDFFGDLPVMVTVHDPEDASDEFALIINVLAVNDAPIAVDDAFRVKYQSSANTLNVLANDTDIENEPLSIVSYRYDGLGSVEIINNHIRYTAPDEYSGMEVFSYQLADDSGGFSSAQVTLTIAEKPKSGGGTLLWTNLFFLLFVGYRNSHRQAN
ncbi:hypothetical protein A9Q98_02930 [Thalassotalea sp. 42_200_T64]|nr:hypothetical protein A9Q98_02930 [Thalassotalea sp. 42_200_T64]